MKTFSLSVVGITFAISKCPEIAYGNIKIEDSVSLVPDPTNQYDKKAIKVMIGGTFYGHVPDRKLSSKEKEDGRINEKEQILNAINNGDNVKCFVNRVATKSKGGENMNMPISIEDGIGICGIGITVDIGSSAPDRVIGIYKTVFGTDIKILFDEDSHKYYHKGNQLTGGTTYIERYLKPFNGAMMSKNCDASYGMNASDIQEAWDMSGYVARTFGTAIHAALEYDVRYQNCDRLYIKHPAIRYITDDFWRFYKKLGFNIKSITPEVLLASIEDGVCGHADILYFNKSTGKYRIQDYKINHGSEIIKKGDITGIFSHLPQNKISKNQLQLSLYANMAKKMGLEIEGLDIFVYTGIIDEKTGSGWKHYERDILEVLNAEEDNTSS